MCFNRSRAFRKTCFRYFHHHRLTFTEATSTLDRFVGSFESLYRQNRTFLDDHGPVFAPIIAMIGEAAPLEAHATRSWNADKKTDLEVKIPDS